MKRTTYLAITGVVILCLVLVFSYGGVGSGQGAEGTSLFSCGKLPTGPETDAKMAPAYDQDTQGNTKASVQLLMADVKYSDHIGSNRWRTTFAVKILLPSGDNVVEQSDIDFYYMKQLPQPLKYDDGWIHIAKEGQFIDHGFMSYEGEWQDRRESVSAQEPVWLMVHVVNPVYGINTRLIGKCDFYEDIEKPTDVWDRERHLRYEPESNSVLVSELIDFRQLN